jgi:hypothetical protein
MKVVKELDNYFNINGEYPDEKSYDIIEKLYRNSFLKDDIAFDESTEPYYYNVGNEYILIYHFGFDPPDLFYNSKTKEWKFEGYIP